MNSKPPLELILLCLWATWMASGAQTNLAPAAARVYQRAAIEFPEADFLKPIGTNAEALSFKLAPLIIQEVPPGADRSDPASSVSRPGQFGALGLSNGMLILDPTRPSIYFHLDQVDLHGKPHARCTYLWCYALKPAGPTASPLVLQGVRLTLDSAGQPAVWEVLADDSATELVFISQSVEAAAREEFGEPLPGRRFVAERSITEAPRVVVPRVLADGPVPLGPMVYLRAGTHAVSTLICRCMPPQAKVLRASDTYALLALENTPANWPITRAKLQSQVRTAFWPADPDTEHRLEECIRLPANF